MDWVLVAEVVVLVVMLGMAAYVAAAEIALTSVNRIRVRRLVEDDVKGAKRLERLTEQPGRFLSVILLATLLLTLGADSLATTMAQKYFGVALGRGASTVLATVAMALLIFIYVEIAPKTVASQQPEKVGLFVAGSIDRLTRMFYPVTRVFIWAASPLVRLLGGRTTAAGPFVTEDEIRTIVTVGEEEGVIEEVEKDMIHSIFEFGDTIVREVMIPRTDMQTIEAGGRLGDAYEAIVGAGHSRIPVWEETMDNVVGILYAKDLLTMRSCDMSGPAPREMLRPAYFVPETKRVSELLRDMRARKVHMAIAVDEYGGIAGLVTIEDLIEEIVGEIFDEYDVEEPMIEELGDGRLRVDARMPLEELAELTTAQLDVEEVDSVGGLVFALAGDIPSEGDAYDLAGLRFTVERVEGRRVQKVLIEHVPPPEHDNGSGEDGTSATGGTDD